LIVREAGGCITNQAGEAIDVWRGDLISAASEPLHQQILGVVGRSNKQ